MLFKIWMSLPNGFDGSIMLEADSLEDAIRKANDLAIKYNATIKAIDNVYYGYNKSTSNKNRSIQGIKGDRKYGSKYL